MIKQNGIYHQDCIEGMKNLPMHSIDCVFADPPYWMQTDGVLMRTEGTTYLGTDDHWDKFSSYHEYDNFTYAWLKETKRCLKKDGSIWVIGAFQNIYRIGVILQDLGFWILNDIIWYKKNPTPNFRGSRFTNAHETLLWCSPSKDAKYTFNYKTMKALNHGKQMKSVWELPLCTGKERCRDEKGQKLHNTQKPIALLERVILSSTKKDDLVLDPFMGSGTTAVVCKKYDRNYIGFEKEEKYLSLIEKRIKETSVSMESDLIDNIYDKKERRVSMKELITKGYLSDKEYLYDSRGQNEAVICHDGTVLINDISYSIHKAAANVLGKENYNGWGYWFVKRNSQLYSINNFRGEARKKSESVRI